MREQAQSKSINRVFSSYPTPLFGLEEGKKQATSTSQSQECCSQKQNGIFWKKVFCFVFLREGGTDKIRKGNRKEDKSASIHICQGGFVFSKKFLPAEVKQNQLE